MIEAVESDTQPFRLMMGADAFGLWEQVLAARQADLASWGERGIATAFDDTDFKPIGG